MNTTRISVLVVAIVLVLGGGTVFALGGGGMTYGMHAFIPPYSNLNLQAAYFGGFGYGVTASGLRIGGFGCAVLDTSPYLTYAGGFGGILTGRQLTSGPLSLALNLWTGLGGVGTSFASPRGFFGLLAEADVELGVAIVPWMQWVVYGGYQAVANLIPGLPIVDALSYTPVAGIRLVWGSF